MLFEGVFLGWDGYTYPYIQHLGWPTWYRSGKKEEREGGRERRGGCITCYREFKEQD